MGQFAEATTVAGLPAAVDIAFGDVMAEPE
jgi:hypothetical protein